MPTPSAKCPHCNGRMETITPPKMAAFQRCMSCGRDDRVVAAPSTAAPARSTAAAPAQKCTVDGCPGSLDGSGQCPQCAKRAAWAEAHMPKRQCKICEGSISGREVRQYCRACRPIVQRAKSSVSYQKAKRGS